MRKIISLICLLLPILVFAADSSTKQDIRDNAPDQYVVVKGDTLWDIAGKFFKTPWKWPEIWGLNKDTIKDPHWIYPGDIIYLDRNSGRLGFGKPGSLGTDKLSPRIREGKSDYDYIPSIPAKAIKPFLSEPLIVDEYLLQTAPAVIGAREERVMLGQGDKGFVKNLEAENGKKWQLYRQGKTFIDPDTKENLGVEAIYLGDADAIAFGNVSTIVVTEAKQEITKGDRLMVYNGEVLSNYLPRAPEADITAKVISIYGGVSQAGQNTIITLNKGERDGLEVGHVLALHRQGEIVKFEGQNEVLPDEQYGMVFVFRVFEKVAYGLVMQTQLPVQLMDKAQKP